MAKKIFIITGEFSGDLHASNVVRELKKINDDVIIEAVGGKNLEAAGVKLFSGHAKMSAMGMNLKIILNHLSLGRRIVDYLKNDFKPDLVILTDYGAFNLAISKHLKLAGFKIFYFIPPQVWASRKWRLKTIKKNIDKVITIFPFEGRMYDEAGVKNEYAGHPLIGQMAPRPNKEEFFIRHGLDLNKKLISVFSGSRMFEIKFLLNIFLKAVEIIERKIPDVQIVFSHAKSLPENAFSVPYKTIKGENQELLALSDFAILASGTVALEAALYETPMVIAYRGPFLFYLIYLMVRSIKRACLVNIISDKDIVPEFLMYDCEAGKISSKVIEIMKNPEPMKAELREFKKLMSDKNCTAETAKIINKELIANG